MLVRDSAGLGGGGGAEYRGDWAKEDMEGFGNEEPAGVPIACWSPELVIVDGFVESKISRSRQNLESEGGEFGHNYKQQLMPT